MLLYATSWLYRTASGLASSAAGAASDLARSVCFHTLRQGSVPRHVAFIMDGNRRYAKKMKVKTIEGHSRGFKKLEETLDWCLDLGVEVVTIYAFSIENFKRPPQEVEPLMDLARSKFEEFCIEGEFIQRHGISVRILGDLSLLPSDVRSAAVKAMKMTESNSKSLLNICFPYTSRQELANAAAEALADGDTGPNAIDERLYTANCPPVDLLIRTSGEVRLSDFLLWQCNEDTQIHFVPVFWPEFGFMDMVRTLMDYNLGLSRRRSSSLAPP
ncbi:Di-trans-poly-cis-decaprenylcistransferase [Hyaloraphidium curvatum]|nr:Di-trans-poly-cis-decaprenylcistransferase [Hyaloraphidium curvatum]